MARRGNNEGSIYKRKDGRYCGQYFDGKKQRYIYGREKETVRVKLARSIADRDAGIVFDSENLTVAAYLEKWLESIELTISPRTYERREQIVRNHLSPPLGRTKIDKLNAMQIQSLYKSKLDEGLSPGTVKGIHATLYMAMKQAHLWQLVPRNVCESVMAPRVEREEVQALTKREVHTLLETARDTNLYPLYLLAVSTGMRIGELLALGWDCVDFHAGTVTVKRSVWKYKITSPKTARSRRTIRLSQTAINALFDHRQLLPVDAVWVFPSRNGGTLNYQNFTHKQFKPLLRRAELKDTKFHTLRHTCCVLLLSDGINPRVVADQLGHSDVGFTLRVYADALSSMGKGAADSMDGLLGD